MFVLVLVLVIVTAAVIARLVTVVRTDRPSSPPRSHGHEVDPFATRTHVP